MLELILRFLILIDGASKNFTTTPALLLQTALVFFLPDAHTHTHGVEICRFVHRKHVGKAILGVLPLP